MECPECEKLHAVHSQSQTIGEFLEWLMNEYAKGPVRLCKWIEGTKYEEVSGYYPVRESITDLLATYFNIDLQKVDDEKRALLAEMQNAG